MGHCLGLDLTNEGLLCINRCAAYWPVHDNMKQYALSWLKAAGWKRHEREMTSFAYVCHSLGVPEYPYPQSEFSEPQLVIENKLHLHYHPQKCCCFLEEARATQTGHHLIKLLIQSFKILVVAFPSRILGPGNSHSIPKFSSCLTFAGGIRLLKWS